MNVNLSFFILVQIKNIYWWSIYIRLIFYTWFLRIFPLLILKILLFIQLIEFSIFFNNIWFFKICFWIDIVIILIIIVWRLYLNNSCFLCFWNVLAVTYFFVIAFIYLISIFLYPYIIGWNNFSQHLLLLTNKYKFNKYIYNQKFLIN